MRDIDREAIISALTGEASPEELRRLKEWRGSSGGNEETYQRIARVWSASDEIVPPRSTAAPPTPRQIVEVARDRLESPIRGGSRHLATGQPLAMLRRLASPTSWGYGWSAAGAATLAVGVFLGFWLSRGDPQRPFGAHAFVTGVDEIATVTLRDETVVRLAPSTRLTILDLTNTREVSLVGRAYFAVTADDQRPFRVRLANGDVVEVLGTRFDVMSRDSAVQVAVAEGDVRLGTLRTRVNLGANDVARVRGGEMPTVERVENVYQVIDWLGPFLAFEGTPVTEVVEELRQRFGLRIEITDPELRGRTVTGWFADQSPQEIIGGICRVTGARCTMENGLHTMTLEP